MDARVMRTRTTLSEALLELIQHQRWDKITVQDLLDRTGVSRSTFYSHYDNKLDVLTSDIPQVTSAFAFGPSDEVLDLGPLFEHVDEMAPVLDPLFSQPVLGDITDRFHRGFVEAWRERLADDPRASGVLPEFLAGALVSVIKDHVTNRHRRPAAIVAAETEVYVRALLDHP
jgi:hypothetical protein